MIPILTAAEVRAAERSHPLLLDNGTLMDRAAHAVATHCLQLFRAHGGAVGRCVLLLVGSGDNGGDALWAGVKLLARGVRVYALPLGARMHAAGAAAFARSGGRILDVAGALALLPDVDIVLDGIVGLGSSRGLDGDAAIMARAINDTDLYTVAIDVPSGVHTDTGACTGVAIDADLTITFGALRAAHVVSPAALQCGEVLVVDIGVPMHSRNACVTDEGHWFLEVDADADKYSRGVVGVVTGSRQYPGAAVLSTGGATKGGAGYVRYFGPASSDVLAWHPEVVSHDRSEIADAHRVHAWVIGCGIGLDDSAVDAVLAVLQQSVPVVMDADAITLVSRVQDVADALAERQQRGGITLLTPHVGEAARLTAAYPGTHVDLVNDRLGALETLTRITQGTAMLLKGPTTIVHVGDEYRATMPLGPDLATAGSGDVLSGLIGSAIARWQAQRPVDLSEVMEIAAACALRHAAAAEGFGTTAGDLMRNLGGDA